MGWTDGEEILYKEDTIKYLKKKIDKQDINSIEIFMKGIVGSCIVEFSNNKEIYFFASCASCGFYWLTERNNSKNETRFIVSNDEGKFFRKALDSGLKLTDGAIMNGILSHQSVIRPIFSGIVEGTNRCQPGFYVKFSNNNFAIKSFLLDLNSKTRAEQDKILLKKMKNLSMIYDKAVKSLNAKAHVSFSGGVDSTALLLNFKKGLSQENHGHYINRGKIAELKIAKKIAELANCKIKFIEPHKNFSHEESKQRAKIGLSTLNGIHYMQHSFQSSPFPINNLNKKFILTGQNSDTMFHIDTFAASSFTTGIIRLIKMSKGIILRFKTTLTYYKILLFFNFINKENPIPYNVKKTFITLSEHDQIQDDLPKNINKIIQNYKYKNYLLAFDNWSKKEFFPILENKTLSHSEKLNHLARIARWMRTVGNFHQQYQNISIFENTIICTPFSEGPIATELLTYKLSLNDIFNPKIFLHKYIKYKLGISYSNIRNKVLGGNFLEMPLEILKLVKKLVTKIIKKLIYNIPIKNRRPDSIINENDLKNLKKIICNEEGKIDRILLTYLSDKDCKKYLSYLYDCLDSKIDPQSLNKVIGMRLCRLVNLQIMITLEKN